MNTASEIGQWLTIEEVYARYPAEWVLLGDPETTEMNEVLAGHLLWHSKDRDEVDRKALESPVSHVASFHTGSPPADLEFAL